MIESGTCVDMLGRTTQCTSRDDIAIGMYFVSPDDVPENLDCGALPPIMIVTGHRRDENDQLIDRIYGCKGTITTYEYPDIFVMDDVWKPYLKYVLIVAILMVLVKLILKVK